MQSVKIHEAKTHLSRLLAAVEAGEEITITRGDVPVAKLVPFPKPSKKPRVPGRLKDLMERKALDLSTFSTVVAGGATSTRTGSFSCSAARWAISSGMVWDT